MNFGGLSENEYKQVIDLLTKAKVPHSGGVDEGMTTANKENMGNDIRHLSPSSISTHILSITIKEQDISLIDQDLKTKLEKYGIYADSTDEIIDVPEGQDLPSAQSVANQAVENARGRSFAMELITAVVILIGFIVFRFILN
jgi:hypothetical protein